MNSLIKLGWNPFFQNLVSEEDLRSFSIARVTEVQRSEFHIRNKFGEFRALVSGRYRFIAVNLVDFPTVGDWVLVRNATQEDLNQGNKAIIERFLNRKSLLIRSSVDPTEQPQPIAANVDTVFIMSSLNREFNPRRLERYVSLVWNSGAIPVVILSKADLCEEIQGYITPVYQAIHNVDIHVISSISGQGMDELDSYFTKGKTSAIIGSSGVGKSTLINALFNDSKIEVQEIRKDGKGKHTTTVRSMHFLPTGGIIIDTPGLRGLQVVEDSNEGTAQVFDDIEELITRCKFKNCQHLTEPGCAVKAAIENGDLEEKRYQSYLKMQKEIRFLERRKTMRNYLQQKKKSKRERAEKNRKMRKNKSW